MGLFGRKKTETAKDPVCGMDVEPMKAAGTYNHDGKPYWFCSKSCLAKFTADPARYAA
ncbi:MAG: YHS domain-containing protein [Thermoplasmatota archaeon]